MVISRSCVEMACWQEVRELSLDGSPLVWSGPVVENDPADSHGHQQEADEKEQEPAHHPPDAGLRGQNAPLGFETVCLAQYPGQQQEETYRKH
jgi:hypothetical protein